MSTNKKKVIKIRVMPIVILVALIIIVNTLIFTDTIQQIGIKLNISNTLREVEVNDVAKITRGGTEYGFATLKEAVDASEDNDIITVISSTTEENIISVNKKITINLDGQGLNIKGIDNSGELTINDGEFAVLDGTAESYVINNTGILNLKHINITNINGYGIKSTGTLNLTTSDIEITAKTTIDGKVNKIYMQGTYGVSNVLNSSSNTYTAKIIKISEATEGIICDNVLYDDIYSALASLKSGMTEMSEIKLLKEQNYSNSEIINIEAGQQVKIDLNGKKISLESNGFISNYGKLEIGNGEVYNLNDVPCFINNYGEMNCFGNIVMTCRDISGGTVRGTTTGFVSNAKNAKINVYGNVVVSNEGTCNVKSNVTIDNISNNDGEINVLSGNIKKLINSSNGNITIEKENDDNILNIDELNLISNGNTKLVNGYIKKVNILSDNGKFIMENRNYWNYLWF